MWRQQGENFPVAAQICGADILQPGRAYKKHYWQTERAYTRRWRELLLLVSAPPITNSSIVRPVLSAEVSQRGCLPRPDHVSDGSFGFRYFGNTVGYLRRSPAASFARPPASSAGGKSFS